MISEIIPSAKYVLIKTAEKETKTLSGIYLPEATEEKSDQGTIVAVGDEKCPFAESDVVIFDKWNSRVVTVDNVEYQLLKYDEILATIKTTNDNS